MMKIKRQNKLRTYLAVTAGVGCAASVAEGAVVFYGVNGANDTNEDPIGINLDSGAVNSGGDLFESKFTQFSDNRLFSRGVDEPVNSATEGLSVRYALSPPVLNLRLGGGLIPVENNFYFTSGAVAGDQNFALISFDSGSAPEAVGQFNFSLEQGGSFLVALAFAEGTTLTDGVTPLTSANAPSDLSDLTNTSTISLSEGVALIEAASVPEPSSLALLALGATGLAARRKRKMAA